MCSISTHQKICIDKRIGFCAVFVVITIGAANLLGVFNQQKTSINSKAAEPVEIICNTKGAVVVKNINRGLLGLNSGILVSGYTRPFERRGGIAAHISFQNLLRLHNKPS